MSTEPVAISALEADAAITADDTFVVVDVASGATRKASASAIKAYTDAHVHSIADVTATGTPSATTFLRGDGAWAAPAGGGEGGGATDHSGLTGLDSADAHPITSITGLRAELDGLQKVVASHAPAAHTVAGALAIDMALGHRKVVSATANITDHTWTNANDGDLVVISYRNTSATDTITVDFSNGFLPRLNEELTTESIQAGGKLIVTGIFDGESDPYLLDVVPITAGSTPVASVTSFHDVWSAHHPDVSVPSQVLGSVTGGSGKAALLVTTGNHNNTVWSTAADDGWTPLGSYFSNAWGSTAAYVRQLDGTADDNATVTGAIMRGFAVFVIDGGDAAAISAVQVGATANDIWSDVAAGTSFDPPNATPTADGSTILTVAVPRYASRTWVTPSGMTSILSGLLGARDIAAAHHPQETAAAFTTEPFTVSGGGSTEAFVATFIIPPAA